MCLVEDSTTPRVFTFFTAPRQKNAGGKKLKHGRGAGCVEIRVCFPLSAEVRSEQVVLCGRSLWTAARAMSCCSDSCDSFVRDESRQSERSKRKRRKRRKRQPQRRRVKRRGEEWKETHAQWERKCVCKLKQLQASMLLKGGGQLLERIDGSVDVRQAELFHQLKKPLYMI